MKGSLQKGCKLRQPGCTSSTSFEGDLPHQYLLPISQSRLGSDRSQLGEFDELALEDTVRRATTVKGLDFRLTTEGVESSRPFVPETEYAIVPYHTCLAK